MQSFGLVRLPRSSLRQHINSRITLTYTFLIKHARVWSVGANKSTVLQPKVTVSSYQSSLHYWGEIDEECLFFFLLMSFSNLSGGATSTTLSKMWVSDPAEAKAHALCTKIKLGTRQFLREKSVGHISFSFSFFSVSAPLKLTTRVVLTNIPPSEYRCSEEYIYIYIYIYYIYIYIFENT